MVNNQRAATAAIPEIPLLPHYSLSATLDSYELEELSGHMLGRMFPKFVKGVKPKKDSVPVSPHVN